MPSSISTSPRDPATSKRDSAAPKRDSAAQKEIPQSKKEIPQPRKGIPRPRKEIPRPRKEIPRPRKEIPQPRKEIPQPRKEIPRSLSNLHKSLIISRHLSIGLHVGIRGRPAAPPPRFVNLRVLRGQKTATKRKIQTTNSTNRHVWENTRRAAASIREPSCSSWSKSSSTHPPEPSATQARKPRSSILKGDQTITRGLHPPGSASGKACKICRDACSLA